MHDSPIPDLYFYLDSKYGFSELEISENEVRRVFREKLPLHAEDFFRNLLAKMFGFKTGKIIERDYDIDIVLHSFRKVKLVAEVKWREEMEWEEIERIGKILSRFPKNVRKILIIPEKTMLNVVPRGIEVWDVNDIVKLI